MDASAPPPASLLPAPAWPAEEHTVLLLEDDPSSATLTQEVLAQYAPQWHLWWVTSLAEAQRRLQQGPLPDLVLLDLSLPDIHGLLTLKALLNLVPQTPIVILTAADPDIASPCLAMGAIGFATKMAMAQDPQAFAALLEASYVRHHTLYREGDVNARDL